MAEEKKPQEVGIKITDEILRGAYANNMVVAHSKEEFFVDFINVIPPQGIVTARVIISPGHMKRIIKALSGTETCGFGLKSDGLANKCESTIYQALKN